MTTFIHSFIHFSFSVGYFLSDWNSLDFWPYILKLLLLLSSPFCLFHHILTFTLSVRLILAICFFFVYTCPFWSYLFLQFQYSILGKCLLVLYFCLQWSVLLFNLYSQLLATVTDNFVYLQNSYVKILIPIQWHWRWGWVWEVIKQWSKALLNGISVLRKGEEMAVFLFAIWGHRKRKLFANQEAGP